uniref:NB-ARC domain-containing protein n=1 Tax=Oryza glumipatula TaxID=40148 RepID=A0A0D9ZYH2_9ORYZ
MAELLSALLPALLKKAGESLSTEFSFIGVIADAEEQASKKLVVKSWITKLKLAACDADDALDELQYEALRSEALRSGHKINSRVRTFFSPTYNPLLFKYKIGKRLQQIVDRINDLVLQIKQFGFDLNQPLKVDERTPTHSCVVDDDIIGRDTERDEIIHTLLSANSNEMLIFPIVGIGGLGKTTLAQFVFNNAKVKAHFQKHIWVCVSEEFDVSDIVKKIIDTSIGKDCELKNNNLELLQQRLREELSRKRYLLVLDDVWNEDEQKWEALRTLLVSSGMGSVVIVTTRSLKVASIMKTDNSLCLKHLTPEDSWTVFRRRAFRAGSGVVETPELVEVGKKIVHKCHGVPLSIKSMGALMSTKHDTRDWLAILESSTWDEKNEIMPALWLSYKHLPSYMKQCFVFCAAFPKDCRIVKDDLIHLWISNGFILSNETSDVELMGNHVFFELVFRSFFQDIEETRSSFSRKEYKYGYSDLTTCKIHDLMHDLAVLISGDECFALQNVTEMEKIPDNVHHLVFPWPYKIDFVVQHRRNTRSLFSLQKNNQYSFKDLKFKESNFRVIGLHFTGIGRFSIEPTFMKHLSCWRLTMLPEGMKFMVKLRHLYLEHCYDLKCMPSGLGQLSSLRTLTTYVVGTDSGRGIQELKDLKLGGKLHIYGLEVTNPLDAKEANLESKQNLHELAVRWRSPSFTRSPVNCADEDSRLCCAEEVLNDLKPPNGLKVLNLKGYMGSRFPTWMVDGVTLHNIVKLSLAGCEMCVKLPPVWQLPFLEVLRLKQMKRLKYLCSKFSDKECDHQILAFPKLKLLSLYRMESLEQWQDMEHDVEQVRPVTFPALDAMEVIDCPNLTVLPNVPMLKLLSVTGNKVLLNLALSITNLSYLYLGGASPGSSWRERTLCYNYDGGCEGSTDTKEEHILADHLLSWGSLTKLHLQGFNTPAPENVKSRSGHMMSVQDLALASCDCFVHHEGLQSPLWFWKSFGCLQQLEIRYCDSLTFWPEEEFQSLTSLEKLFIVNCRNFTGVPPAQLSVRSSTDEGPCNLEYLRINGCPNLVVFPTNFSCLQILDITDSNVLEGLPEGFGCLGTLIYLVISCHPRLTSLPDSIQCLSNLEYLELADNNSLTVLPEGMQNLTALNALYIVNCQGIKVLPEGLQQRLHILREFTVKGCPALARRCKHGGDYWSKVKDIPRLCVRGEQHSAWGDAARAIIPTCSNSWCTPTVPPPLLKRLAIRYCKNFTGMPPAQVSVKSSEDEDMHNLESLEITCCSNLVAFPTSFTCLRYLMVCVCNVFEGLPEGLGFLGTLRSMSIYFNPRLKSLLASIQRLSNLTGFFLGFNDSLTTLPEGMENLTALNDLTIQKCPGRKALPEGLQQRLHSLERLFIEDCPSLARRCKRGGDYWSKILFDQRKHISLSELSHHASHVEKFRSACGFMLLLRTGELEL